MTETKRRNNEPPRMTGKQLKSLRLLRGLTQSQLAEELGVSQRTVRAYEDEFRKIPRPVQKLLEPR